MPKQNGKNQLTSQTSKRIICHETRSASRLSLYGFISLAIDFHGYPKSQNRAVFAKVWAFFAKRVKTGSFLQK